MLSEMMAHVRLGILYYIIISKEKRILIIKFFILCNEVVHVNSLINNF
jgi:hypothetical protein